MQVVGPILQPAVGVAPDDTVPLHPPGPQPVARQWLARTPFANIRSIDAELRQLAALRWVAGIICFARTLPIVYGSIHYIGVPAEGGLPEITIAGLVVLGLIAVATAGFATPVTLPLLIVRYQAFDERMQTESLGTDVLLLLLALFWVAGAGAHLSVDAWLLRRTSRIVAPIHILYRVIRIPSRAELSRLYFLFFTAFAIMNFGAVVYHLDDPAWRSGSALRLLFTSSYLSLEWATFRRIEARWPALLQAFSVVSTVGQVAFQLFMLPLMWSRWGRRMVIAWGAAFFLLSLLVLQLSFLPWLEILLWIALFRRPQRFHPAQVEPGPAWRRGDTAARTWLALGTAVLVAFALTGVPYVDDLWGTTGETIRHRLKAVGLEVPEVLNRDDLRMGDTWPVVYRREGDRSVLLPYHGLHGERLAWVRWNDLFYFANSLKWRREFSGPSSLTRSSDSYQRLVAVALFDHRRRDAESSKYTIVYYATQGSDLDLDVRRRFRRRSVGNDSIACVGRGQAATCE
jgi:hypothetical protein